ncbi:L,D-transpeptidase [Anabaena sp. PCC 7108]|uniref:L,D-transpeptidase n=1 Tax=Anabaena sp. PCC 7108 TaxID=163908 RepID=UPI00034624E3|nr:L,D-transpeptidase [Anabaena sp. PCC 7108]
MKSLIYPHWVRSLKILLASTVIYTGIFSTVSSQVWANPDNNKIATAIQTLKQSDQRWIQIDLSKQNLIAWEGSNPVYAITISSGKKSTPTRVGTFKIQTKLKKARMRGRGYDVPNVPHTMYYQGGYAIHGAYWHHRFGTPVSHGCVNLAPNHAKWVFEWADVGTPVIVQE